MTPQTTAHMRGGFLTTEPTMPSTQELTTIRDYLRARIKAIGGARTMEATTHMHALSLELHMIETLLSTASDAQQRG